MSETNKQGGFCKTMCWLIGIGSGGYLGYVLVTDHGVEMMPASVFGIVGMLLVGLLFRKLLCGRTGNKVEARQDSSRKSRQDDKVQSEAEASAVMASAAASVAPTAAAIDTDIDKRLNAIADDIAVPRSAAMPKEMPKVAKGTDSKKSSSKRSRSSGSSKTSSESRGSSGSASFETSKTKKSKYSSKRRSSAEKPAEVTSSKQNEVQNEILSDGAKAAVTAMKAAATPLSSIVETMEKSETVQPEPVTQEANVAPVSAAPDAPAAAKIKPLEPKGLEQPENNSPDDLAVLSGINESQVEALHNAGIYHFSQIVGMNRRELAWLDENISGEQDRAPAGEWRKQAIQIGRKAS